MFPAAEIPLSVVKVLSGLNHVSTFPCIVRESHLCRVSRVERLFRDRLLFDRFHFGFVRFQLFDLRVFSFF